MQTVVLSRLFLVPFLLLTLGAPVGAFAQDQSSDGDATTNQVLVEVKGGDRIHGKLVSENEDSVVVVSPILGTMRLSREQIEGITYQDAEAEAAAKAEAAKAAKAAEAAAAAAKEASPWTAGINLGFSYSRASTVTSSLNIGAQVQKKTDLQTLTLNAKYFYSYDDGSVTDNDIIVNFDDTWYLTKDSRWNYFVKASYQWDEFQQWEQRFSPYAGFGYAIERSDDLTWNLQLGGGGTWEYSGDRGFDPQFLFATNVDWTIDKQQSLTAGVKIAPKITEFSNYLLTLSANYKLRIGNDSPVSLNLSLLDIYDSSATGDSSPNDLKLVLSLGYDF